MADFNDVCTALENLDGRVVTNTTNLNNILDGSAGLVRQDPGTLLVTVAGQTGGTQVSLANVDGDARRLRSEEHTSELQSLMRISYAVFCLKKKKKTIINTLTNIQNK